MSAPPPYTQKKPTRLLNRYELLDEMPHVTGGRLFRARDLAFAEMVGIKQFGEGCGLGPEARGQLEETVRHLQCLPHQHLVRLYSLDASAGLLVQEWIHGFSLLDLLRRRRALPVGETLQLLATLPATLDFLAREAVPAPRPLLGKLFVQFESSTNPDNFATTPIDQWPPFTLKLNALSIRGLVTSASVEDTTSTIIADPREPSDISDSYGPREFARLLYELLGGRIREVDARRYSPIGALREAGNAVLRRTLLAMPHADCQTLWQDLLSAQAEFQRVSPPVPPSLFSQVRPLQISKPLLAGAQPGTVLTLEPTNSSTPPIRLVARPRVNIGRSPQQADFVARLLPENDANEVLNNRLSRIHTILERTATSLQARDGNGTGPSLNGSILDGQALRPEPATPLTDRSLLWLGKEYALELVPVFQQASRAFPVANIETWPGPGPEEPSTDGLAGAIVFLPANCPTVFRQVAWLFTEVGFGLDASEQLLWDTRGRHTSPATFFYHRGCFWLGNRTLPEGSLACNDTPLHRDEIAPLAAKQIVRLGSRTFNVRLE